MQNLKNYDMEVIIAVSELTFIITWIIFRFKIERKEKDARIYGGLSLVASLILLVVECIDAKALGLMIPLINLAVLFTPMLLQAKKKQ